MILASGVELAKVPDKPRVRCAFEQRVRNGADENLGGGHASMNQSLRMADISVDHFDSSPPESRVNKRIEVNDGNVSKKVFPLLAQFFQERACRAKEADQENLRPSAFVSR